MKTSSKSSIINAAKTLFATRRDDSASMDATAAEVQVAKATVCGHFRCKDTLFSTVLRSYLAKLPPPRSIVPSRHGALRERLSAPQPTTLPEATSPDVSRILA